MINTVRGRLTLWYVTVLALVLAIFGAAFYVLLSRALYTRMDNGLRSLIEVSTRSGGGFDQSPLDLQPVQAIDSDFNACFSPSDSFNQRFYTVA